MIVMKFGGTSVGDAAHIRRVVELVRARLQDARASSCRRTAASTDALLDQAHKAVAGKHDLGELRARHQRICDDLGVAVPEHEQLFQELSDLLRGISLVAESTPRLLRPRRELRRAALGPHGRRRALQGGRRGRGGDGLRRGPQTDSRYQRARPLPESFDAIAQNLARPRQGVRRHRLRREGRGPARSRPSAATAPTTARSLFGRALHASEIQIWTDVPGVMTADPRLVPDARPIECMTYDEAAEIAFCGGKVLHPATLQPAIEKEIPVRVLDTRNPTGPNTVIWREIPPSRPIVRTVVQKRGIVLINIVTPRMLGAHGFMARIFEAAARHEVALDMIATTEISVSATVDDDRRHLPGFLKELEQFSRGDARPRRRRRRRRRPRRRRVPETIGAIFSTLAHEQIPCAW
jgi:aspartate kinase